MTTMAEATLQVTGAPTAEIRPGRQPEPGQMRYLDLDGDGVPDAVQRTLVTVLHRTSEGLADVVRVVEELEADIGDDGAPGVVQVTERLEVDDGFRRGAELIAR